MNADRTKDGPPDKKQRPGRPLVVSFSPNVDFRLCDSGGCCEYGIVQRACAGDESCTQSRDIDGQRAITDPGGDIHSNLAAGYFYLASSGIAGQS
jgi:hypothetical protein